jgi:UDP-N-acetylglucosamine diphosphorylase/glucosamine-1-phosphate N-acetyltransferase
MNRIVLDDTAIQADLFPFTLTRSVLDIRLGIFTLREKWERLSGQIPILQSQEPAYTGLSLPAGLIPNPRLAEILAGKEDNQEEELRAYLKTAPRIRFPWDLFQLNDQAIRNDFELVARGRRSEPIPFSNQSILPENIFIEEGARISFSTLNASAGPIYIGRNAEIMEGSLIRGPFALCEGSLVKMGTKIYGATTIGPYSTVGGEIKNSVIFGYSNKAHDGYLGDAVIGEWCNLGAGTSNSNLKNNAAPVKVWQHSTDQYIPAGLKCGLLMGDYSRCSINTSFNTGTVTGVCCNIFGEGLTPKFIPSFTWGYGDSPRYEFDKALRDIANWKRLKNQLLRDEEIQTLKHIFDRP